MVHEGKAEVPNPIWVVEPIPLALICHVAGAPGATVWLSGESVNASAASDYQCGRYWLLRIRIDNFALKGRCRDLCR